MNAGFGTTLLGKPSHDAIIKLQEYEIKLLEVIKKTVSSRIKADKEYSHALSQIALQSSKIETPGYDSPVYTAWREIVHEISQMGQNIKRSAELLQSSTQDKVVSLIKDKIAIKKNYAEHRERMDNDLLKVIHTELDRKHNLYVKTENDAGNAHQNYDAALAKQTTKLAALEKAQEKYRKTTMKLHNYHNDYVLQIEEAQLHQQHYRSSILPELLNGLHYMGMQYVDAIKDIASEFLHHISPCREEFISCHKEAEAKVKEIDSALEYQCFMDSHRTHLESEAVICFEPLSKEGSNLPHGNLLLNTLSLQGVEHLLHGYEEDLEVIQGQIDDHNQRLNVLDEEIRQFTQNIGQLSLMVKQQEFMNIKLELTEQEHLQLRQQKLKYLLNQSLQSLGDQDPPPGLVLKEIDGMSFTSTTSATSLSNEKSAVGKIISFGKSRLFAAKSTKPPTGETKEPPLFDPSKSYKQQSWFHGAIPRQEAVRLLPANGDFLLRESTNNPGEIVLSSRSDEQIRHFKIQTTESGYFRFEADAFSSIYDLVHYHYSKNLPVTKKTKCLLLNPICKDKWQLMHDDINIDVKDKLGAGNFGTVYKGLMVSTNEYVAVKTCKDTLGVTSKDKFLMEARILKGYDHPNIVKLIGICTDKQPIYIVMELVSGGDLAEYVKIQQAYLKQNNLVKLCRDACAGLAYLEEKRCIHRDVAARNCLVSDQAVVKITDFGMSREEDDGIYTVSGSMKSIPMRWTAPEAMNFGTFTSASDVWSFGILSWEVFSFGKQPYPRMTNQQARDRVNAGYRLPHQQNCPVRYYDEVMLASWNADPDRRPHFSSLLQTINSILNTL